MNVDDAELRNAFVGCIAQVERALQSNGETFASLAAKIEVGESALKQFIRRGRANTPGSIRRGAAFAAIYAYFHRGSRVDVDALMQVIESTSEGSDSAKKAIVYTLLMGMMNVQPEAQTAGANFVFKKLYCFRNATREGFIIKSEIIFNQIPTSSKYPLPDVWEFYHGYRDNNGVEKTSDGIAFSIKDTVYLMGDLKNSGGLDILILRNTLDAADYFLGFQISVDDYRPFFTNIVCLRADLFDSGAPSPGAEGGIHVNIEGTGPIQKVEIEKSGLLGHKEFGVSLLKQLNIDGADHAIRIKASHILPMKQGRI